MNQQNFVNQWTLHAMNKNEFTVYHNDITCTNYFKPGTCNLILVTCTWQLITVSNYILVHSNLYIMIYSPLGNINLQKISLNDK